MNVLVTGAARGLGRSLTARFLMEGATVYAGVRSTRAAAHLEDLRKTYPDALHICPLDVRDEEAVRRCAQLMAIKIGSLDVLINNAAILVEKDASIETLSVSDLEEVFGVNTLGPIKVVKHFAPLLRQSTNAIVINVSSEAGSLTTTGKDNYPYCISKAALNMFTHILRNELEGMATVYALHPGRMRTDMGVPNFPLHPDETAAAVFRLVSGQARVEPEDWFINLYGEAMPL